MKNNFYKKLYKIDEHKSYHMKQYTYNILLTHHNDLLNTCLAHIKNLQPLNAEIKTNIYNMTPEEKMLIILEYDNNLQSLLKNVLN